jgi:hypothetical protein
MFRYSINDFTSNTHSVSSHYRNQPDDYKYKNDTLPVIQDPIKKRSLNTLQKFKTNYNNE